MSDTPTPDLASDIKDERRLEERQTVHWPILVSSTSAPGAVRGRTMELSFGGVRATVERNFAVGEKVACRLTVQPWHGNSNVFDIDMFAKVVHSAYSAKNGGFDLGLQFTTFSADGKERLAGVMKSLQRGVSVTESKVLRSGR